MKDENFLHMLHMGGISILNNPQKSLILLDMLNRSLEFTNFLNNVA